MSQQTDTPASAAYQHAVYPDARGRFGEFGGRFVPESLMSALDELEREFTSALKDEAFLAELRVQERTYSGRPTPLYFARRLSQRVGARVYLKREDLAHTGAHKINNALGQGLLAQRMGKRRVIAETGAGQHGVATATIAAKLGMQCVVYMGEEDIRRQSLNVFRMKLLGAEVRPVSSGSRTLKDATNEAMRDWVTNVADTFYIIGSAVGPHPYPKMVRAFQSVIGQEARAQIQDAEGRLPDLVIACVGGGSNAIGIFYPFAGDASVRLVGVEAGGAGLATGRHSATLVAGRPGVLHGAMSYLLQDDDGQVIETLSISAGLTRLRYAPSRRSAPTRASSPRWSRRMRWRICWRWARLASCATIRSSSSTSPGAATKTSTPSPMRWASHSRNCPIGGWGTMRHRASR